MERNDCRIFLFYQHTNKVDFGTEGKTIKDAIAKINILLNDSKKNKNKMLS